MSIKQNISRGHFENFHKYYHVFQCQISARKFLKFGKIANTDLQKHKNLSHFYFYGNFQDVHERIAHVVVY